ncbi:MAG: glutamate-5-semialdehyde dehydrogenase [Alphaproteobacteria bacterium]|nr:glutamate-5-semialdehyde dehydrogenase [Alphaproteobacteria bacterium]
MAPNALPLVAEPAAGQDVDVAALMEDLGRRARVAAHVLANASKAAKDQALRTAAAEIRARTDAIGQANAQDMAAAEARGTKGAFLDRLKLTPDRIEAMAAGLEQIADLDDPVGAVIAEWTRPNGLVIERVRVPLGVIGVIYESRPNVTADAGGLCLKAGNASILRGGSESFHSSRAIADCLHAGLSAAGLPADAIQLVPTTDREAVGEMLKLTDYIDVIVPRGGKSLIARLAEESRIPLFQHLEGLCHTYVHGRADAEMARAIAVNAKMRRTGICGAMETLLIDRAVVRDQLPPLCTALREAGCTDLRADAAARAVVPDLTPASDDDWQTEYLDAILSIKVVDGIDEAIGFINENGSNHTDSIITDDPQAAEQFLNRVDSAIVLHNASTQFADGGEFGMGAEIGIATGKLHARGPVGVEQLTSFKYKVRGAGHTRP